MTTLPHPLPCHKLAEICLAVSRPVPSRSQLARLLIVHLLIVAALATACDLGMAIAADSFEPFVEHVDPPSVPRGQTIRLALVGARLDRATDVWTSLPPGRLKVRAVVASTPERTELEVETTADCPVGLYGLRLATEDGLSNLHLFAVDDLSPRAALSDPHADFPVAATGALLPGAVERHRIQVTAGQQLTFEVLASRFGHDADPLVTILDARGRRVAQRDNSPGLFFDACFSHTFAEAGVHTIEVRDARFLGSPHWRYLLRIGDFPAAHVCIPSALSPGVATNLKLPQFAGPDIALQVPADAPPGESYFDVRRPGDRAGVWLPCLVTSVPSVIEQEPNDAPEQATPAPHLPTYLHGVLASPADRDYFELELKKGDRLTFKAETKTIQSAADVELVVFDSTGRELQRSDDVSLPGGALDEATLSINIGQDGKYRLLVRDVTRAGGPDFTYRIDVQRQTPRVQLLAETSALAVPRDSYQVVPISAVRTEYTGPIKLRLDGAPPGVSLDPDTIPANTNAIVCAVRTTAAAPLGVHSFRIVAQLAETDMPRDFVVAAQPLVDRQFINVDLIRHALRDNQRYLPRSVRTQFALQITPPAPFALDPPDRAVVLPRYQSVDLPFAPIRAAGFDGPITFSALSAGQLGEETQGRKQVFYRFPALAAGQPQVVASIHSRSQANEAQERVDVYASAQVGARRVTLNRSVSLSVKPAFEVTLEPAQLQLAPGKSTKAKVVTKRLPSFAGPIMVTIANSQPGVTLPNMLLVPAGQTEVEFEVLAAADTKPRRERIRFVGTAPVGNFQEEPRPVDLDLEIKLEAPAPATK